MKDWQFWTFMALFWILGGVFAPWPLSLLFFAGAIGIGIAVHFIQRRELKNERTKLEIQRLIILALFKEFEEIKELLGRKRKNKKEVK